MNEAATNVTPASARWFVVIKQATLLAAVAALLAFGTNAVRADGLSLVAQKDFEIVVPCPEPVGAATEIGPEDPRLRDPNTLIIDARAREEYESWHLASAINAPFDWLAEQDAITAQSQQIARDIARTRKHALVVYGDGGDPDSGRQWAVSLNSAGIRNVFYVRGGAPALHPESSVAPALHPESSAAPAATEQP